MTLPTDPIVRCKLLEAQVAELTERVEALETGKNLKLTPEFLAEIAEALTARKARINSAAGRSERTREQVEAAHLRSLIMLGESGARPLQHG